jgi:hypothetical protein
MPKDDSAMISVAEMALEVLGSNRDDVDIR